MLKSTVFTEAGKIHAAEGSACEDVVMTIESESFCFYGLADGQSRKRYCTEGARRTLAAAAEYIRSSGISGRYTERDFRRMQYGLAKTVRAELELMSAEYSENILEFGSTLIALGVDPRSGRYVLAHLGDGRAAGIRPNGEIRNLSAPENGLRLNQTWLTTSPNAAAHIRVYAGSAENYDRIIIMSDGADGVFRRGLSLGKTAGLAADKERRKLLDYIKENLPEDDSACIIIDRDMQPMLKT